MIKVKSTTLPLEGGGQGGGEIVAFTLCKAALYALTPPHTPPPLGAGSGRRRVSNFEEHMQ